MSVCLHTNWLVHQRRIVASYSHLPQHCCPCLYLVLGESLFAAVVVVVVVSVLLAAHSLSQLYIELNCLARNRRRKQNRKQVEMPSRLQLGVSAKRLFPPPPHTHTPMTLQPFLIKSRKCQSVVNQLRIPKQTH